MQIFFADRNHCKRLSFKVIENGHVLEAEICDQLLGANHPVAIGQIDFITIDRACNSQNG
ncbi:hypothetical protein D9M70_588840 [compost metagenome]